MGRCGAEIKVSNTSGVFEAIGKANMKKLYLIGGPVGVGERAGGPGP